MTDRIIRWSTAGAVVGVASVAAVASYEHAYARDVFAIWPATWPVHGRATYAGALIDIRQSRWCHEVSLLRRRVDT